MRTQAHTHTSAQVGTLALLSKDPSRAGVSIEMNQSFCAAAKARGSGSMPADSHTARSRTPCHPSSAPPHRAHVAQAGDRIALFGSVLKCGMQHECRIHNCTTWVHYCYGVHYYSVARSYECTVGCTTMHGATECTMAA